MMLLMDNPYLLIVLYCVFSVLLIVSLILSILESRRERDLWPIISAVLEIIAWLALGYTVFKGM